MEAEDFGFHDYESAMLNGDWLVLSGFRVFPQAGGFYDQYVTDTEDLLMYLKGLAWARSLKDDEHDLDEELEELADQQPKGIKEIADWQSLL